MRDYLGIYLVTTLSSVLAVQNSFSHLDQIAILAIVLP
jgi:hypothetical protein